MDVIVSRESTVAQIRDGSVPLNHAVTLVKLLQIASGKILGRASSGVGDVELLDATAAGLALLDDADASAQLTTLGFSAFVKSLIDDANAGTFLTSLGLSAFVQTLLDNADAATARSTLGAAAAANAVLTGTPTAPTATANTNSTQISTTAFVQTAIANLVASSPSALDTLNELAAALGNDANFATTVNSALAARALLDASNLSAGNVTSWTQKLALGTAAALNVASSGNATATQVVKGNDTRLVNAATMGKAIAMSIVFGG